MSNFKKVKRIYPDGTADFYLNMDKVFGIREFENDTGGFCLVYLSNDGAQVIEVEGAADELLGSVVTGDWVDELDAKEFVVVYADEKLTTKD